MYRLHFFDDCPKENAFQQKVNSADTRLSKILQHFNYQSQSVKENTGVYHILIFMHFFEENNSSNNKKKIILYKYYA